MTTLPFDAVEQVTRTRLLGALKKAFSLTTRLKGFHGMDAKFEWMQKDQRIKEAFSRYPEVVYVLSQSGIEESFVLALTVLLDQFERLFNGFEKLDDKVESVRKFLGLLVDTERFYSPIGGLLGYYEQVLHLMTIGKEESFPDLYPPPLHDMRERTQEVWRYCYEGVSRLSEVS